MKQTIKQVLGLQGPIRSSKPSPIFIPILLSISFSHTQHVHSRQIVDCADPAAITDPSCWEVLGVPAWLSQFAGPNSTCAASDLAPLAGANSSWGACFILTINQGAEGQMVAVGLGRLNENITAFSLSRDALEITPVGDGPRYLYVLSALWSIRGFFMDWNEAVSSNATGSKSDVLAILAALDPSQQTSFAVDDLYQSLMLGLPFFLAYNGSEIPLGLSLADINGLLLELVDFAVMPHSSISSPVHVTEMIQAKSIRSLLPQLAIVEGSSVQYCFQSTVSNLDTFRNVTTDGAFASSMPWYIPQDLASVAQPFYTFLVSSILAQQNWAVLALVGIEVAALSYGSSGTLPGWVLSNCPTCNPPVDFGCTTYDENSQCGR